MAEAYVDKVANELADLALADQKASGDIGIVDQIGDVLGASSQTLQESYLTAVRVRRAEERARNILKDRAANGYVATPTPKPAPLQHVEETEDVAEEAPETAQPAASPTTMPRRVTR